MEIGEVANHLLFRRTLFRQRRTVTEPSLWITEMVAEEEYFLETYYIDI